MAKTATRVAKNFPREMKFSAREKKFIWRGKNSGTHAEGKCARNASKAVRAGHFGARGRFLSLDNTE
jgi:hypothetical protein